MSPVVVSAPTALTRSGYRDVVVASPGDLYGLVPVTGSGRSPVSLASLVELATLDVEVRSLLVQ